MCLWFRRKPEPETDNSPRSGDPNITAPISGAYADPVSPPTTIIAGSIPRQTETQQPSSEPSTSETARSHQNSADPEVTASTQQPPNAASQISPYLLQQVTLERAKSTSSTQFSVNHSAASSPAYSPQPSPKCLKISSEGQGQSQLQTGRQTTSISLGHAPNGLNKTLSSQRRQSGSPSLIQAPIPAHQAYIASDQLSIGSKLSPGFTVSNSNTTTPSSAGPKTANSNFSHEMGYGSGYCSPTVSPIDGRDPWGGKSSRDSVQSTSRLLSDLAIQQREAETAAEAERERKYKTVTPPWEKKHIPVVAVPGAGQSPGDGKNKDGVKETEKYGKKRLSLYMPTIKFSNVPKNKRSAVDSERQKEISPDTASPVEQWPGRM